LAGIAAGAVVAGLGLGTASLVIEPVDMPGAVAPDPEAAPQDVEPDAEGGETDPAAVPETGAPADAPEPTTPEEDAPQAPAEDDGTDTAEPAPASGGDEADAPPAQSPEASPQDEVAPADPAEPGPDAEDDAASEPEAGTAPDEAPDAPDAPQDDGTTTDAGEDAGGDEAGSADGADQSAASDTSDTPVASDTSDPPGETDGAAPEADPDTGADDTGTAEAETSPALGMEVEAAGDEAGEEAADEQSEAPDAPESPVADAADAAPPPGSTAGSESGAGEDPDAEAEPAPEASSDDESAVAEPEAPPRDETAEVQAEPAPAPEQTPEPAPEAAPADETAMAEPGSDPDAPASPVVTGRLPAIGADAADGDQTSAPARASALERNAVAFTAPDDLPLMALLLLDTAAERAAFADLGALPFPVSVAVDASALDAAEAIAFYRDQGLEVVTILPLPEGATAADIEINLEAYAPLLEDSVAAMAEAGLGFQALGDGAVQLAVNLAETGHGFVSYPAGLNTGHKAAQKEGVRAGLVFRDLDAEGQAGPVIRRFLDNAAFRARNEEQVIVVARTREETVQALLEWSLGTRAASVTLAPISAVLGAR
jgi:uncharacterized protein